PLAVSLAERRPFLERRIRAMTTPRPRKPLLTSLALTALVIVATTAASVAPRPSPLASRAQRHELPPPPALRQSVDAGQPPASVSAVAIDTAVRAAAPRDTGATKIRALVAAKLPTTKRVGEITPELIRALLILHHPNLFADDATSQVVTMVFDHNQNYAFSYLGKEAFGELPVRASSLADALEDSAKVMKAKEMAEMKMMRLRELKEPNVGDVADTAAIGDRKAALEKQLVEMVGMSEKLRPEMIDQMQSYKFAAGAVTPGTLAVIVIVLKERSGT
ncbi:MAG TPA: hypothetical protein VK636_12800, partial [Gemmatimonadaceae bacterium]|nr:hypothetical protein [Gemmatimonadaceae bacterium]